MITSKVIKFNIFSKTENNLEKKLFSFSLILFLILGIMYLYFVGDTTFNIIKRKEINNNTQSISSEIRELELEYLTLNQKINLNLAYPLLMFKLWLEILFF